MSFEGNCQSFQDFDVQFSILKHPVLEHLAKFFFEKVNVLKFLLKIPCISPTLMFFNIMPAARNTTTYFTALYGF